MKKIKAIAVLMAMTLTFSMFATAASAAEITYVSENYGSLPDCPTLADFNANLANAKYAALFDFDGIVPSDSTSGSVSMTTTNGTLETGIVGGAENEKCVLTLTEGSATIYDYDITGLPSDSTAANGTTAVFASNLDCMTINNGNFATMSFGGNDALKPVEIGYLLTIHAGRASTRFENNVTINLASISDPSVKSSESTTWAGTSGNKVLRFYGYKAPVGQYIESVTISNAGGSRELRIDDLCVVYKEASNIAIRYSKDASGYVEYTGLSQLDGTIYITTPWATGKKIIVAEYEKGGKLYSVECVAEDTASTTFDMWANRLKRLDAIKIFVLDKATLVPACVNATIE